MEARIAQPRQINEDGNLETPMNSEGIATLAIHQNRVYDSFSAFAAIMSRPMRQLLASTSQTRRRLQRQLQSFQGSYVKNRILGFRIGLGPRNNSVAL